jgi:NlpC/P60 family
MSERDRFVDGMRRRVGGPYCSYPNFRDDCADCSTTIAQEYFKATGRTITGSSHAQAALGVSAGSDWRLWQPGDILVYLGGNHTGVYVGNGQAVHAMNESQGVTISSVQSPYWMNNFVDARRLSWSDAPAPPPKPPKPPKPKPKPKPKPPKPKPPKRRKDRVKKEGWA